MLVSPGGEGFKGRAQRFSLGSELVHGSDRGAFDDFPFDKPGFDQFTKAGGKHAVGERWDDFGDLGEP